MLKREAAKPAGREERASAGRRGAGVIAPLRRGHRVLFALLAVLLPLLLLLGLAARRESAASEPLPAELTVEGPVTTE